jgi:hypothetical protein
MRCHRPLLVLSSLPIILTTRLWNRLMPVRSQRTNSRPKLYRGRKHSPDIPRGCFLKNRTGYRGLSLDLCNCDGGFVFCHGGAESGCGIGQRDPIDSFTQINDWLTLNPNNVVMIWLQINEAAGGPISLQDVESIVNAVPLGSSNRSFADRLYKRNANDTTWPTLSELIQAEQQVIFFFMGGPDDSAVPPLGMHYFYDFGMSTDWSYASVEELRDTTLNGCTINRASSHRVDFLMLNAFVTESFFGFQVRPSVQAAEEVNTEGFLQPLLDACNDFHSKSVNIVSVDFWNSGNLPTLVDVHNANLATAARGVNSSLTTAPTTNPNSVATWPQSEPPSSAPLLRKHRR